MLANLKSSIDELVQLVPITVQKIADLRAAPAGTADAELQALADTINAHVIAPLAAATADPPKV